MAYLDLAARETGSSQRAAPAIRLGDAERRVILNARRDVQAGRRGAVIADARLEALRCYAMLGRQASGLAAHGLIAAGFSATERRIIDAMVATLPTRARKPAPVAGRIVCAVLILIPLLMAVGAYGWANAYLQDRLIAVVLGGLAALAFMPFAGAALSPAPRLRPVR